MVSGTTASKVLGSFCVAVFAAALLSQGFGVFPPPGGSGTGLPTGCTDAGGGAIQCSGGFAAGDGTSQSKLLLPELTTNGTSEWGIFGPGSLAVDRLYVMPSADSNGGDCLSDSGTTTMTSEDTPRVATVLVWVACGGSSGGLSVDGLYLKSGSDYYVPGPTMVAVTLPALPSWAWRNQGGASVATTGNAVLLSIPASASASNRIREIAVPATPYTCTIGYMMNTRAEQYAGTGMVLTDGTKLILWGQAADSASITGVNLAANKWDSVTAYNSTYSGSKETENVMPSPITWLQISNDATNYTFKTSKDGLNYRTVVTKAVGDFLTATTIGFYGDNSSVNSGFTATILHWKCE